MKKILILGAGFLQSFVIKRAKELGYYTLAVDKNPDSIGFKYADEFEIIDIVDKEACLKFAQIKQVNGVMTAATDYGVISAAYIANKMKLPGLNYDVAKIIKNKYKVRSILSQNMKDSVIQYNEINDISDIENIKDSISYPIMVKPCDGSGSKGVKKVNSVSELKEACKYAMKESLTNKVFIENYIEGKEYGVESFVYNGKVYILGIIGKKMTLPPDYAELGHYMPSGLIIEDKIKDVIGKAINVLGIDFGSVNMDILVTEHNEITIIDVGARMGGNLIGSHIIPMGTGIDYMGNLIKASIGEVIDMEQKHDSYTVATRLLALQPGKVIGLPDFNKLRKEYRVDILEHINLGDSIRSYHNNLDGCGYVVASGSEIKEVEDRVERVKRVIDISIIRK